jgi:putative transposase
VDSQSVKTTGVGREQRGYDGGKKVKGRKRHLLVDTQGLVLKAKVHSAKIQDLTRASRFCWISHRITFRASAICGWTLATPEKARAQTTGWTDHWVDRVLGWTAQIVRHPPKMAPEEVMRRWVRECGPKRELRSIQRSSGDRGGSEICLGGGW